MSAITKLPDGSAFFTATIMSREEAVKLPFNDRPICFRISSEMYHAIFQAVGTASMCWTPRPRTEVFDASEAEKIATDLCFIAAEERENAILKATKVIEHFFGGNPPDGLVNVVLAVSEGRL
jgi:hypothetical protein